jgi:hypothetical protein
MLTRYGSIGGREEREHSRVEELFVERGAVEAGASVQASGIAFAAACGQGANPCRERSFSPFAGQALRDARAEHSLSVCPRDEKASRNNASRKRFFLKEPATNENPDT